MYQSSRKAASWYWNRNSLQALHLHYSELLLQSPQGLDQLRLKQHQRAAAHHPILVGTHPTQHRLCFSWYLYSCPYSGLHSRLFRYPAFHCHDFSPENHKKPLRTSKTPPENRFQCENRCDYATSISAYCQNPPAYLPEFHPDHKFQDYPAYAFPLARLLVPLHLGGYQKIYFSYDQKKILPAHLPVQNHQNQKNPPEHPSRLMYPYYLENLYLPENPA